jgi:CHAD domain-containing protein
MDAASELRLPSTYHPCTQTAGILRGHLTAALTILNSAKPSRSRIHAARQELKRARATLRLLRESIDSHCYRQEDGTLRQAAGCLNEARDSDVLFRVFTRLQKSLKDEQPRMNLEPLREQLLQERRSTASHAHSERLKPARTLLMQSKERIHDWSIDNDLDLLTRAMQRTYRRGRAYYRAARESHATEEIHAWRRQVKYSAYQLETVGSFAPRKIGRRLRRCARLAKLLGRDHDLSLLQARISDTRLDVASALRLTNAIRHERTRLQRQALKLGERLYRIKPRQFHPLN